MKRKDSNEWLQFEVMISGHIIRSNFPGKLEIDVLAMITCFKQKDNDKLYRQFGHYSALLLNELLENYQKGLWTTKVIFILMNVTSV